jgi:BRCT domain type II-containing protein
VRRLRAAGVRMTETASTEWGSLAGRRFVLTGALPGLTRDEAAARIEALGGRVSDSVSRATDALIVGQAPGRKLRDARGLGVPILRPAQFEALLLSSRRSRLGSSPAALAAGEGRKFCRLRQDEVPAAPGHKAGVGELAQ